MQYLNSIQRTFFFALALALSACTTGKTAFDGPGGNEALQNGPMIGHTDMREALIWVQTKSAAVVQIAYWEKSNPGKKYFTEKVPTQWASAFTAKCYADEVEPGKSYDYQVIINGKAASFPYPTTFKTQTLWQWRTEPPAFSIATGSCYHRNEAAYDRSGAPYGADEQIFTHITTQKPDVMLWLGDNTYYREADYYSRTGMVKRMTYSRQLPEMQALLASTAHYAIWDDHDYGPNDADASYPLKETAWEIFRDFWGNPSFGVEGQKGCTTMFQYGDVDFFLLDNRYFRTPNYCRSCPDRTLLGKTQLEWFKAALAKSQAPFKIVAIGGQVVTSNNNHETCFHFFPAERDSILNHIAREKIKGVVFLTGDRHFSELSIMKNKAGYNVYDLTTSPLTSGPYENAEKEQNEHRVEGTLYTKRNFSMLRFSGPRKNRQMQITNYDSNGKENWTRIIKEGE